ncbi:glycosyltransferase [Actinomyces viscosus]|uniref:GDP-mannose-dependent alpha-(1-2)-phosphatidylinositol mannosyltransferase n=1 Tax=Actinomyces viscosus TaxID=1656 RepID=A0A448PJI7_ACTVI|nr:glycosyltransferase family 4 protein [Actinomyces viscosus]TFH52294.1 glycosyltransferase [Actinomyces viscosus]VEI15105.1 GDP-mannose-dependent alpha-(1-2)-phosphatidylinositol mannosyltransferase [Actinomyces viscosus]
MSSIDVNGSNQADASQRAARTGRLRVLQVSGSAAGGVRAHLADCAQVLATDGHDVIVEAPATVLDGLDVAPARAEALEIGPRPSLNDTLAVARLRRLGRRADAVHAHGLRAGALAALALGRRRRGRIRLIVTLHNLTVGGRLTTLVGDRLERLIASRADLVLAVSPDLAQRARGLGAPHVELAVVPVATPRPPSEPTPPAPATPEAWPREGARVLTVARLAPQKGLPLLLDAAAILARDVEAGRLPAVTWAVAGDGPGREQAAERIAAEHLPVTLLGRRADAPALMEAADVVVQTSLWEGQPLTIQEALRAGAAIVATDVGGTAVTARGGAVLIAPEAQAIAEAVAALLNDPEARSRARRSACKAAGLLPGPHDLASQLRRTVLSQD